MDENKNFFGQIAAIYRSLPSDRKLIIAASIIVFFGALFFWISSTSEPDYGLLYGDLNLQDSGKIVSALQSRNMNYKLADGGRSILVPSDQLLQARIDLASEDILPSGSTGFELFDKSNLGLTEFTQHVNKQRAIQGELERTLKAMEGIELARVQVNLPEQSPFMEDAEKAEASVMVRLSPRYRDLAQEKVMAIQNLVASVDSRLSPDDVAVVDSTMNLLSRKRSDDPALANLPEALALKQKIEAYEGDKIKGFLEKTFGAGKVAVSVSVDMNFDQIEKETKNYEPLEGSNKGVLKKEDLEEEKTSGSGAQGAQGVPGTTSNVPGYPATEEGTFESESSKESKEYDVSEEWERTVFAPGTIKKMSVSVLLNGEEKDANKEREVEQLVQAATNIDTARGDKIVVTMVPFDPNYLAELDRQQIGEAEKAQPVWYKWIPSAVIMLFAFVLFLWLMKPIKQGYKLPRVEELDDDDEIELPAQDPEAIRKLRMREEITRLADHDPASAARIIKTWLSQS